MAEGLILAVPEVLSALYLVPTTLSAQKAEERAKAALAARVMGPVGTAARKMLGVGAVKVASRPSSVMPPLPTWLQQHLGVAPEMIQAVTQAERFAVFGASWPPGWPPVHESVARASAAALAADIDTPLVDTFVPKVITSRQAISTLPDADSQLRLADWVLVLQSTENPGLWMTTKGLGRFGLPELQARNVPPQMGGPWTAVLSGLASRVLDLWLDALRERKEPAFAEIPAAIEVAESDVASAYGTAAKGRGHTTIRLVIDPSSAAPADSFLTVQPPDDYHASAGEYLVSVCTELFGKPGQGVRYLTLTAAMEQAMRRARETLPTIRARFLEGQLPLGARLMVKHKIRTTAGNEYPWAYVNSWKNPDKVLGNSASDAELDPGVRAGRPVVVDADTIIDWAIWIDGRGVIEGGQTNAVALEQGLAEMP